MDCWEGGDSRRLSLPAPRLRSLLLARGSRGSRGRGCGFASIISRRPSPQSGSSTPPGVTTESSLNSRQGPGAATVLSRPSILLLCGPRSPGPRLSEEQAALQGQPTALLAPFLFLTPHETGPSGPQTPASPAPRMEEPLS